MPIYFCGDSSIDNYEFYGEFKPLSPEYSDWNAPSKITVRQLGGVYLLALFTGVAWSLLYGPQANRKGPINRLQPWTKFEKKELGRRLHALYRRPRNYDHFWQFSYQLDKCGNEYRVPRRGPIGVTLPTDLNRSAEVVDAKQLPLNTASDVKLFIVNYRKPSAGDKTHGRHQALANSIVGDGDNWAILKVRDPPKKDEAVALLSTLVGNSEKVIAIISADEFRKLGIPISRSLSWERTLRDIIKGVRSGQLLPGNTPSHLIITFDYDAALYLRIRPKPKGRNQSERRVETGVLVFSVGGSEGEFESRIDGDMPGAQTTFVSMFSTLFYKQLTNMAKNKPSKGDPLKDVDTMLGCALIAKRRCLQSGFAIIDENGRPFQTETIIAGTKRTIPILLYSEGIFSLQTILPSHGDPSLALPDPFIGSEKQGKQRDFFDPFTHAKEFKASLAGQGLAIYKFKHGEIPQDDWPDDWSIFRKVKDDEERQPKDGKKDILEGTSDPARYVANGIIRNHFPICSFGKIRTADVREIEDFRTVANLLQAYLSNPVQTKPLGIAVFGPAGAGKSFAVKNIVETLPEPVRKLIRDDRLECNLTALSGPEDLAHYFQLARNSVLRGKVPMLFFDEFDCTVGDSRFFWLKHFLAPLQDGEFRSGQIVHPIGRVIFVFAGSVCENFEKFVEEMNNNRDSVQSLSSMPESEDGPNFKGVDFLSRLHGHMDIVAFTPTKNEAFFHDRKGDKQPILIDPSYLMRRAFVLRSLLELHLEQIFSKGSSRNVRIDAKIVNALLATRIFFHGARSMEAILRMSYLEGSDRFEISHLPPDKQLGMHVDSGNFNYCLEQNVDLLWREARHARSAARSR